MSLGPLRVAEALTRNVAATPATGFSMVSRPTSSALTASLFGRAPPEDPPELAGSRAISPSATVSELTSRLRCTRAVGDQTIFTPCSVA